MESLRQAGVSPYLRRIIGSYLQDRFIITAGGERHRMTAGVPQGSILGPTSRNIAYNGKLAVEKPEGVDLVGYADDLALVVKARTERGLVREANAVMDTVARWMEERHLALAPEKTEAVLLLGRKKCGTLTGLSLRGCAIEPRRVAKYLGVILVLKSGGLEKAEIRPKNAVGTAIDGNPHLQSVSHGRFQCGAGGRSPDSMAHAG